MTAKNDFLRKLFFDKIIVEIKMAVVYITCKGGKEAEKISRHLLEKKLIGCANMFPIKSMFWWEGKIDECSETVIIAKTLDYEKVKEEVKKIHSYSVPCVLKIEAEANPEYVEWLKEVIGFR